MGNQMNAGDAFGQTLESLAFVASLALALPTDGASIEVEEAVEGGSVAVAKETAGGVGEAAETTGTKLLPSYIGYQPWAGEIRSVTAASDTTMYRVWGGGARQVGSWLSPVPPTSAASATESLALPAANTAQFYSKVLVPTGTRYQIGTAAAANGLGGGGVQVQLIDQIPTANFGPAILLH
jgi:hypothetical protein